MRNIFPTYATLSWFKSKLPLFVGRWLLLKQTALYLPWNSCWVWKFVSIACFPHIGIKRWKTTATPLVWTAAWIWQNMRLIYIVHPPKCPFQLESYQGLIWKLLENRLFAAESQKWRRGNTGGGNKWQNPSTEMPCLGWCTGNRLLPARKWSGKQRPAYISPPTSDGPC